MTQTVSDWLMQRLAELGVRHVFVLPGGGAMHLNDALARSPSIQAVACQHEQACGIAAEAYGRTGAEGAPRFGVAMVTTGPGATNAVTPVAGAWIDSIPMMVISGQAKRVDLLKGRPLRQTGVQEVDIVSVVKPITKFAATVQAADEVRSVFEQAMVAMLVGRQGPVWIDVPLDVQAAPFPESGAIIASESVSPSQEPETDLPCVGDIDRIERLLAGAQRPLVLVGHGVRLAGAGAQLRQWVERLGLPCVFTWNALDLLPHAHDLNIGRPGVVASRGANFAVQNADLLICLGARLDPVVTAYNRRAFGRSAMKVIVDIDAEELQDKRDIPDSMQLRADAAVVLDMLLKRPLAARRIELEPWRARCLRWKQDYPLHPPQSFAERGTISHAHFVRAFSDAAPADTLIATGSSGLAVEFLYAGLQNKEGQRVFLTSGLGAMGYGLPAAIGACMGAGGKPILAVESDGSLQLNVQELATLSAQKLPVCLFVMNNGGYASIRNTQRNYFSGRYLGSDAASGLGQPDLKALAAGYGVGYARIDDAADLAAQLERVMELPRPCLIDVHLQADEVLQPKCGAIPQPGGGMLSMPLEDMSPLMSLADLRHEMMVPLSEASLRAREHSA
jgi:acetolactate synthase-1/2/3 large subunit